MLTKLNTLEDFWSINYFNLFYKTSCYKEVILPELTSLKVSIKYKRNSSIYLDQFINKMFFSRSFLVLRSGYSQKRGKREGFNLLYKSPFPSLMYCFLIYCFSFNPNKFLFMIKHPNLSIKVKGLSAFSLSKYYYSYSDSDWNVNATILFDFLYKDNIPISSASLFKFYQKN